MKLIGLILAHAEKSSTCGDIPIPTLCGYDEGQVHYHVQLCVDAGFVEPLLNGSSIGGIDRLTWSGHEKLEDLRQQHPELS